MTGAQAPRRCVGHVEDIDQAAARVPNGRDHPPQAPAAVVFDDDGSGGGEVRPQVGVHALGIAGRRRDPVIGETPGEGTAFDEKLDLENAGEHPVQGPDDQLVLADGQRTHNRRLYGGRPRGWSTPP